MEKQQVFTRKEVRALLKRQIQASYHSYQTFPVNMTLVKGISSQEYADDLHANCQRLKKVNIIKF